MPGVLKLPRRTMATAWGSRGPSPKVLLRDVTLRSERAALASLGIADKTGEKVLPAALARLIAIEVRVEADVPKGEQPVLVIVLGELEGDLCAAPLGVARV